MILKRLPQLPWHHMVGAALIVACLASFSAVAQTVNIDPSDSDILYTGRFELSDPSQPKFSMVGTSIKFRFNGTGVTAQFESDVRKSYLYVIIDGNDDPEDRQVLTITSKGQQPKTYTLASGLSNGTHEIEVIKINEYDTKVTFHGLTVSGSGLAPKPARPNLLIEYFGDSNPAGTSTWDVYDSGAPDVNGGYWTYPAITARLLGAEFANNSGGGAGVTSQGYWNLVDYHDYIHMDDPQSAANTWDFDNNFWGKDPDVVVINLGANDYWGGATKNQIKNGWKNFITNDLRSYYPNTHIVLANSIGWATGEPADYVHEAVNELAASGDQNVSFVKFPWYWGQEHAVANEHAGFANILADHIADELNLPNPGTSDLSSLTPFGELANGSFEKSTLAGAADGWRPHGNVTLVENAADAQDGSNYYRLGSTAWVNFAMPAQPGAQVTISGWMRANRNNRQGKLKLEFKDQGQATISSREGLKTLNTSWQYFTTTATVPAGCWSVWVVLVAERRATVDFDQIEFTVNSSNRTLADRATDALDEQLQIAVYPNPVSSTLHVKNVDGALIRILSMDGKPMLSTTHEQIDVQHLPKGMYLIEVPSLGYQSRFIKL